MFGWFSRLILNAKELGRFKRLVKQISISALTPVTVASLLGRNRDAALDELADWMATREEVASVLQIYGYSRPQGKAKLLEIYWTLLKGGAGQWVGKKYVPTVALYDARLLNQLLEIERSDEYSPKNKVLTMAITALDYVGAKGRKA
ncbi:MAG: hypothetical protein ACLP3R_15330 [Candidatus Korobacteraceae bacterium]